jgi:hypothetical protein
MPQITVSQETADRALIARGRVLGDEGPRWLYISRPCEEHASCRVYHLPKSTIHARILN